MKINLIIFLSEFILGGAGNSVYKLCKNLPKKKYNISVICLNKCYYKRLLNKHSVKVYEIKSSRTILGFFKIKKLVENIIKNKTNSNIFISNIYYSNILSILFLRRLNLKICLIERTPFQELKIFYSFKDFIKKTILKILIRLTFSKADVCVSNSRFISTVYNKKYNLKFKTIFPPSFDQKINIKVKKNSKKIKFVTVCRLTKEKGLDKLIKIFSELDNKISLYIIGNGPYMNNLKKMVAELNLKSKIFFKGQISPFKIKSNLKFYDYYINHSDFEGFPNTVVEALSSNLPVLASQSYGGINEILPNKKYGIIYKNEDELYYYLKKLSKNNLKISLTKNEIFNHLNKFSEKENLLNYDKLFTKLIK